MAKDLIDLSAMETAAAMAAGKLTSEALTAACRSRIETREPDVQASAHFDPE